MTAHDDAARLALLKVIADRLKETKAVADGQVTAGWRPKDRATAVLPGGSEIGAVTLVSGRKTARMVDETAFTAWVERTHPGEMETVTITRPNPNFVHRLMSAAQQIGHPVDAATGEEVPGIQVVQGDPYPMVKLAPDAAEVVAAAWEDDRGLLAELVGELLRPAVEGGSQ